MIDLGPRAPFLLGLLSRPMTVQELHEMVGKGVGNKELADMIDELLPVDGPFEDYLRRIWEDGPVDIARQMIRLERASLVGRAGGGPEAGLWFRT